MSASASIASIPPNLSPSLSQVSRDVPSAILPLVGACTNPSKFCIYGAPKAKKLLVLTGDSHAFMWAPPIAAVASKLGYRLGVSWLPGCPSTVVTQPACNSFKSKVDSAIAAQKPALVILAERTAGLSEQPTWPVSDVSWAQGLAGRILRLEKASKVALIYDTPPMPASPALCLAIKANDVQRCGSPLASQNPLYQTKSKAEHDAVAFAHATGIDPLPWLCGSQCSPIIGTSVVYYDQTHVATSWAMKLAGVLQEKIAPLLRR